MNVDATVPFDSRLGLRDKEKKRGGHGQCLDFERVRCTLEPAAIHFGSDFYNLNEVRFSLAHLG